MLCYNVTKCAMLPVSAMLPVKRVGTGCSSIGNGPGPNDDLKSECRTSRRRAQVFRLGLAIGGIGFAISSEDDIEQERPLLSSIAEELGFTFVAVILGVEDPDRIARAA